MAGPTAPFTSADLEPSEFFEETLDKIREGRRRRRKRRAMASVAIILALLVAAAVFVVTQRHVATEVTLEEARSAFRAAKHVPSTTSGDSQQPTAARSAPVHAKRSAPSVHAAPAPAAAPDAFTLPQEGVFAYSAEGGDRINVFGASHEYPERVFATVRHMGGCGWEHRMDVIEEHVDIRKLCNAESRLEHISEARWVEFFGKTDGGEMRCDPPQLLHARGDAPGTTSRAVARNDKGDRADIVRTYLGRESVTVGGVDVEAIHFRLDAKVSGKVDGKTMDEFWVSPANGLTLRWDRIVDTMADSAFGARVRYQEEASFKLLSLDPQR